MPPLKNPCAICQCREADKKNSHIVPLCIIKNLVAIDGEKEVRDRELSFSISSHELNTAYVGRDILPEKVGELFGDEIANKVSTEGKNQFAQDYFLCTSCENKLGDLESELTKSFLDPINKFRQENATEIRFQKNNDRIRLFFMRLKCDKQECLNAHSNPERVIRMESNPSGITYPFLTILHFCFF